MKSPNPAPPREEGNVSLPDGRSLAWARFGRPDGTPLLYFHGTPGSRLEAGFAAAAAARLGLEFLAVDRPGYGGSSADPRRSPASFARDLAVLTAALELPAPALLGVSGGAPFAVAAAGCTELAATGLFLVCPVAPLTPPLGPPAGLPRFWSLLRGSGRRSRPGALVLGLAAKLARAHPDRVLQLNSRWLGPADRAALGTPRLRSLLAANLAESLRPGSAGLQGDLAAFVSDWRDFLPARPPAGRIWHGGADRLVPPACGRRVAELLGGMPLDCQVAEGHFSLPLNQCDEILETVAGFSPRRRPRNRLSPLPEEAVMDERIRTFLDAPAFGVAGASRNRNKYGNKVLRCYLQNGRRAVPVHPVEKVIEDQPCLPSVADLPDEVVSLSVITPPSVTEKIVEAAAARGIRNIWMQPGAESHAAVEYCRRHGLNVIADGSCLLVVLGYRED